MGALVALLVAALHPELVKRVILLCSPGAHVDGLWLGLRTLGKIFLDFCHLFWHRDHRRQWILWKSAPGFLVYLFTNPFRTVAEGWHASFFRAFQLLYPQVRANNIKVPVFYGGKDLLFRKKLVAKALAELGIEEVYLMEEIGHDVQFQPVGTVDNLVASGQL
jgi:pimeloyl-ACP methyl ester carboxylesterase